MDKNDYAKYHKHAYKFKGITESKKRIVLNQHLVLVNNLIIR